MRIDCPGLFEAASAGVLPFLCALDQELGALLMRRSVVPRCSRQGHTEKSAANANCFVFLFSFLRPKLVHVGMVPGPRRIQFNWGRPMHGLLKWPRAAGPFLAAAKLEVRLLVALYQAAKDSVCC